MKVPIIVILTFLTPLVLITAVSVGRQPNRIAWIEACTNADFTVKQCVVLYDLKYAAGPQAELDAFKAGANVGKGKMF